MITPRVILFLLAGSALHGQSPGFTKIEITPTDVGSTATDIFSTSPTSDPALFFGTDFGGRIRAVDFNTSPQGTLVEGGFVTDQYAPLGVTMNTVRISASIFGGNQYGPGFAVENDPPQVYTFDPPVIAAGIINTSPDKDLIEFFAGPDATGDLLFSFRDQEAAPSPNFNIDRFVGGLAGDGQTIGSMRISNATGNLEFDELIFAVPLSPCLDEEDLPPGFRFEKLDLEVVVPGNSNPFLSGQPDGTTTKSDSAPDQSPVFATEVTPGDILAFVVEGQVSHAALDPPINPADGGLIWASASALGLAGYTGANAHPIDALVGVFLNDGVPADPPPAELAYPEGRSFEILAPQLHQIFYIGDGLTGEKTGGGDRQQFVVPAGATRLFLGTSDAFGWFNNTGQFDVAICRLRNLDYDSDLGPTTIRFNQPAYSAQFGDPVDGSIVIDPLPSGGLYSQGMIVTVRDQAGILAGAFAPTATNPLDFDGLLLGAASRGTDGPGLGGVKGTARFDTSRSTLADTTLATFQLTGLPAGLYDLAITPWNQLGPTEDIFVTGFSETLDPFITFEPATVEIIGGGTPELTLTGEITVNAQTGLLDQAVTFTNNTGLPLDGFRLFVTGLPEGVVLWNAHGMIDGVPYIDYFGTLQPGESVVLLLEYFRPSRDPGLSPGFNVQPAAGTLPQAGQDAPLNLNLRVLRLDRNGLLIEFLTDASKSYLVEYSDNMQDWFVSQPPIQGTGQRVQWIDTGPPKTMSFPAGARFYRIVEHIDE